MQNPIIFACFQPILTFFPPDLSMKYRIFISIVDISANLKNIDIDIDKEIFENIDIDIDKEILENIDIDKISNRLEFGISNRAKQTPFSRMLVFGTDDIKDLQQKRLWTLQLGQQCV